MTKQKKLSAISMKLQKAKKNPKIQTILTAFLILTLFVFSLGMAQGTLGKFSKSFVFTDSALAVKFDVDVTTPEEFVAGQGETFFEYRFLSSIDIKVFSFQVSNNGEVDVLCIPHISNGIMYRIFVSEEECTDFIVNANETVNFLLVIGPEGLDENIKDAEFFIDIWQLEGG